MKKTIKLFFHLIIIYFISWLVVFNLTSQKYKYFFTYWIDILTNNAGFHDGLFILYSVFLFIILTAVYSIYLFLQKKQTGKAVSKRVVKK